MQLTIKDLKKGEWYFMTTWFDLYIKFNSLKGEKNIIITTDHISTSNKEYNINGEFGNKPTYIRSVSIDEIFQYLPEDHPDKIIQNTNSHIESLIKLINNV